VDFSSGAAPFGFEGAVFFWVSAFAIEQAVYFAGS
jgi:hypothetical protein